MSNRPEGSNPSAGSASIHSAGLGGWERHTKGIGSKLLEKMGYKAGQGLGKNDEGIVEPIKIQANKGRAILGSDPRRESQRPDRKEYASSEDSDSSEDRVQWISGDSPKPEEEDEDSPVQISKKLLASNQSIINELKEQLRMEQAEQSLLKKSLVDHQDELRYNEELIEDYRGILKMIQDLETIDRSGKLDLKSFWDSYSTSMSPTTRCHLIQIFALPILRKQYYQIRTQSLETSKPDMHLLELRLFPHIIDVAREWLKTKNCYGQLIDWYLEWKSALEELGSTEQVRYFRRKFLDVMFLSTIKNARDLNSFKYTPYDSARKDSRAGSSGLKSRGGYVDPDKSVLSFKQLVEQTANDHGLVFRPQDGRTHESKQIYKLDKITICIDKNVILKREENGEWWPKRLDELIS